MKKKVIIISTIVVLFFIFFFPFPLHLKDGGSTMYKAILYSVTKYHSIAENPDEYYGGWRIDIFGINVYDNKHLIKT